MTFTQHRGLRIGRLNLYYVSACQRLSDVLAGASRGIRSTWVSLPAFSSSLGWITSLSLLIVATILIVASVMIYNSRTRELAKTERQLASTAFVLAEYTSQVFRTVESAQGSILEYIKSLKISSSADLRRSMSGDEARLELGRRLGGLEKVATISLIDAEGDLVNHSTLNALTPFNITDREHFRVLKSDPRAKLHFGRPALSRATGAWTIFLAQKVTGSNNEFLGLVVALVDIQALQTFYGKVAPVIDGHVSLIRRDGVLLARYPPAEAKLGTSFANNPRFQSVLESGNGGAVRLYSIVDGKERLVVSASPPQYPIVIAVGTTVEAALRNWRADTILIVIACFGIVLLVLILSLLIAQQFVRQRFRSQRLIDSEKVRLHAALENMPHGLAMFDAEHKLIVSNKRYAEIYGLSPSDVSPGTPLREIVEKRIAIGAYSFRDTETYLQELAAAIKGSAATTELLSNGRRINISRQPISQGGWVAVHQDVTELTLTEARFKAADQELITQRYAIDQAAIVGITDVTGRIVYANDKFCQISGYTRQELLGQNHRVLNSGLHSREFFRTMYRRVAHGHVWRGEICNKSKTGSHYWLDTTIVPMMGEDRKPTAYMAIRVDISAQKHAETALQESKLQLQKLVLQLGTVLTSVTEGIAMFDAEQKLVMCNPRYASMYRLSPDQLRPGTHLRQIVEWRIENGLFAFDSPSQYLEQRLAPFNGIAAAIERLSDGRFICISRQSTVEGGIVVTHRDVTESETLRDRFSAAIENMSHGLSMFDSNQELLVCNARYAEIYELPDALRKPGTSLRSILLHRIQRGLHVGTDTDQFLRDRLTALARPQSWNCIDECANGRSISISHSPISGGGTVITHEDVTESRRIEVSLAEQKALNEMQRGFFSMASHEFRTPLAVIDSSAQKLKKRAAILQPDDIAARAESIRGSVKRIVALMESVLALAKHDNGQFRITATECNVRKIALDCIERQTEATTTHRIEVDLTHLPEFIVADPSALDQIFTNLLSNAVKYSPAELPIAVRGWLLADEIVLEFKDRGIGMDDEDVSRLFGRFFRAKTALGIAGTGIGLYVVKILAEQHGGSVSVRSIKGSGSTFTVRLPVAGPRTPAQSEHPLRRKADHDPKVAA